ncbi:putative amidase AmiD [compost metagenome]
MSERPLHFKSLTEVSHLIRTGQLTSVAVTRAMFDRIAAVDSIYSSYAFLCEDRALSQAAQLDGEIAAGTWRGHLHGVPIAIKDLCYTTFAPTTGGGKVHSKFMAPYNATIVDRLENAGAVVLGKLAMTEGAYTSHHPDIPYPPNPWNEDYWVGSSSTGSGVATSAGLCFGSIGSDTGGSIRLPSATCGLTGIKPTWGRVSRRGIFELAASFDHLGPMTRSAADAAAILQAISGWDKDDPTSVDAPVPDYMAEVGKGVRDLRIGFDREYALAGVDADNTAALERAIETFRALGARIVETKFPPYRELIAHWNTLCSVETALAHLQTYPSNSASYGPALAQHIELGLATSGLDIAKGNAQRMVFNGALSSMFNDIDCMIIPTLPLPIPSLAQMSEYGADPDVLLSIIRFTAPFDFSGTPTITLPNGVDKNGLPTSMQLIGPRLSEGTLIRAGHAFQTLTDWHLKVPPMRACTAAK